MRSHLWYKTIDQVKAYVGNQCALLNLFPSNFPLVMNVCLDSMKTSSCYTFLWLSYQRHSDTVIFCAGV